MSKVAVIQVPPKILDREQTIEDAVALVDQAATEGAGLIVFPEAFIPGYPAWMWRLRPGSDFSLSKTLYSRLFENAVDLGGEDLSPLLAAAEKHNVTIVCGMNERDGELSRGTLYNTVVVIGPDGRMHNRHRKLMPTNPERMVWGFGDGSGLKVVETPCGRIGTLLCWENYMPLARYALYAGGIEVYIAPTYDSGDGWIGTLQHIAREGRCWVVGCGCVLKVSDIPDDFPEKESLYPDPEEWVNPGDSVVIEPGGKIVEGPLRKETGILYAELDPAVVGTAKCSLDIVGHYSRPDIFQLHVNTQPQSPITVK